MDYSKYYLTEFNNYISASTTSSNTLKNYLSDLRIFFKYITDQGQEVTPQNLVFFLTDPRLSQYETFLADHTPLSSAKRRISSLKKFIEYCATQGIVINTPPPPPLPDEALAKSGLPTDLSAVALAKEEALVKESLPEQDMSVSISPPPPPPPPPIPVPPPFFNQLTPKPEPTYTESPVVLPVVPEPEIQISPAPEIHSPMFHELPDFSALDEQLPIVSQPKIKSKIIFPKKLIIWFLVYFGIFLVSLISTILVGLLISQS